MKRLTCFVVVMVGMFAGVARADIPSTERDVLVALYNSGGGAGWKIQTNWNSASGTECTWYGVTCDSGTSTHVIRIGLPSNNLTGTIPSLTGLTALQSFDVSNGCCPFNPPFNKLTGTIPSLTGLTALQSFNVGGNQLTGTIPSLTGLTALQSFNVSNNFGLTGPIPPLTGLTALQSFEADFNCPVPDVRNSLTGV